MQLKPFVFLAVLPVSSAIPTHKHRRHRRDSQGHLTMTATPFLAADVERQMSPTPGVESSSVWANTSRYASGSESVSEAVSDGTSTFVSDSFTESESSEGNGTLIADFETLESDTSIGNATMAPESISSVSFSSASDADVSAFPTANVSGTAPLSDISSVSESVASSSTLAGDVTLNTSTPVLSSTAEPSDTNLSSTSAGWLSSISTAVWGSSTDVSSTSSAYPSASSRPKNTTGPSDIHGDLQNFEPPTQKFVDGSVSCDEFPVGQGVVDLSWVGLGGWASVMDMDGSTAEGCKDGFYCSYACQAGMSKTQWPSSQPGDGRSVGGLYCKDGKLHRSNPGADYLCQWDVDSAAAVNKVGQPIAMCRTDYPASENMVVPTVLEPGSSKPVSVVDANNYYMWQGKKTSTQYYVNNAGVSVEDGCVWGENGSGIGNWAPVVLGAGYDNGISYLSIIPNPNNKVPPNYNVRIVASPGSKVIGDCKYENGVYNGEGTDGCTVSVLSGTANFEFY
ncbi:ADR322Wp [Eremothecium gossypii ATCC 10895]|uniref:ADR322Wp n=1 Tax=Eremothecium gossypii (strain ATCC 10895 / CBS 109.51 / FGSC 9923 / NRRL Y-1056) TaxID=284811 RepID=Q759F4_EREGS|nr:ADR322Wp [Eremothecium gossypii ATCC 10895]AAS52242.1 ADR322Wp [Eremothecium gossypii ATCC 10895]AEY96541.1 FADR322Wp [Eremothecium gossypii FDAG1]